MAATPNIKSTDQIIGAFGTQTDAVSLARNIVEATAAGDWKKFGLAATDSIKLGLFYAEQFGRETGKVGLVNSAAAAVLKYNALEDKLGAGQATTYADWAELVAEIGNLGGELAKLGKSPAAMEAMLVLKGGSVLLSYSAVAFGYLTITEQAQIIDNGRSELQRIDAATGGSSSITINLNAASVDFYQEALNGTPTSLSILSSSDKILVVQRLSKKLDPTDTFAVYTVQTGDNATNIEDRFGIPRGLLVKFNKDIADPNRIYAGEQIYVPISKADNNASSAPFSVNVGPSQFYIDDAFPYDVQTIAFLTGTSESALAAANPGVNFDDLNAGQLINLTPVDNSRLSTKTVVGVGNTPVAATDPTLWNGLAVSGGNYEVSTDGNALNLDHILVGGIDNTFNAFYTQVITDNFRPGNDNLAQEILATKLADQFFGNPGVQNALIWDPAIKAAALNILDTRAQLCSPTDPLVLDLNGDGVKLTDWLTDPVLFDVDHDGGSTEQTGWVSKEDGLVVIDRDHNGKIDDISEALSEYFAGAVGTGGNAGTKPYANGLAALKSLDSNADNAFTSADSAWAAVMVWQDINHDGVTAITGELKTLTELGITAIDLKQTPQSGLVSGGNEILATSTFLQHGVIKEAVAANFLANPIGQTRTVSGSGWLFSNQGTSNSIASQVYLAGNDGETIDLAEKGATNSLGSVGNDILSGTAANNWLVGGQGSDIFNAGEGDDVLLIDAEDRQANIHGGAGADIAMVVGNSGVALNLTGAGIEAAVGGRGNDTLVGGGRSSVFVRGGDGDDIIVGGAASDALSGESGDDFIDGSSGNDVIRGHRGEDRLIGGAGDDLLFGGQEDDILSGGAGNDVLKGDQGDDALDGGDGIDVAEFSGSYADYLITRITGSYWNPDQVRWRVVDTRTDRAGGGDGADTLAQVELLSFSDVRNLDIAGYLDPGFIILPVKDTLTTNAAGHNLSRTSAQTISQSQLLGNDNNLLASARVDESPYPLQVSEVMDAQGGTAILQADGSIVFTPRPDYAGVLAFSYTVKNLASRGLGLVDPANPQAGAIAEIKARVYLLTPDLPSDPLLVQEAYLSDANIFAAWGTATSPGYSGVGVKIGQFEPQGSYSTGAEVFDYRHPDLQANADKVWLNAMDANGNSEIPQTFSGHATMVAGIMVAARNGEGGVGVAYGATVAGYSMARGEGLSPAEIAQQMASATHHFSEYDVVNNSWGPSVPFANVITPLGAVEAGIGEAISQGRRNLGTAVVFSAGNDRQAGGNSNTNAIAANWATITVAGISPAPNLGNLQPNATRVSNPGANILVSATGSYVTSTSKGQSNENGSIFGQDYASGAGTSFAAPIVSGVIALMLEANPNLGYRDIQAILAASATRVKDANGANSTVWTYNAAKDWNAGGMHTSHDFGFGLVDAKAAVRLAETWGVQNTFGNLDVLHANSGILNWVIPDGVMGGLGSKITMQSGLTIESAQISVELAHGIPGDLIVELIAPSGTTSVLLNRTGKKLGSGDDDRGDRFPETLGFSLNSTHVRGEASGGEWELRVIDAATGTTGMLKNWKLDLYGRMDDGTNTYVFTNEFGDYNIASGSRYILSDDNGGVDAINASAVDGNTQINLNEGAVSIIAGRTIKFQGGIEIVYTGDGNDTLAGNAEGNRLEGGRGNDYLNGGAQRDWLDGGRGNDTLIGGSDGDLFAVRRDANSSDTILDFALATPGEKIILVGFPDVANYDDLDFSQQGADVLVSFGMGQTLLVKGVQVAQLTEQSFGFIKDLGMLGAYLAYSSATLLPVGSQGGDSLGLNPNPVQGISAFGLAGNDILASRGGHDLLDGGDGNDVLYGDYVDEASGFGVLPEGNDWLEGGGGDDTLYGGGGCQASCRLHGC